MIKVTIQNIIKYEFRTHKTMPTMRVKGKKVKVAPIYWAIFLSTKIIIVILFIIFVLKEFTHVLDPYFVKMLLMLLI
ncbi:hypothetical protein [Methanolapillus millepedarum]|uniref:Uncharacterized protein n=1 Tax=Methanolapillus millepedarum TaxID=3028296 RepID=A0AA96VD97_9EURY|nr:hypothetical protein MsAc7_17190 [Methanosarcinaceae archaeon Ac7]